MRVRRPQLRWSAAIATVLVASAVLAADGQPSSSLQPAIPKAMKGEQCVEDTATMRRNHMRMLEHQRDATVHGGIRGAKHSLKGCVDCHAGTKTGSVAQAEGDFCVACHQYAAVKIDCFGCHASKPAAKAAAQADDTASLVAALRRGLAARQTQARR